MNGFVVEITSVAQRDEPRHTMWLAELDGEACMVSVRDLAKVFPAEPEALDAAFEYKNHHRNIVWAFAVVPA
jgi:hypothetical protein